MRAGQPWKERLQPVLAPSFYTFCLLPRACPLQIKTSITPINDQEGGVFISPEIPILGP